MKKILSHIHEYTFIITKWLSQKKKKKKKKRRKKKRTIFYTFYNIIHTIAEQNLNSSVIFALKEGKEGENLVLNVFVTRRFKNNLIRKYFQCILIG